MTKLPVVALDDEAETVHPLIHDSVSIEVVSPNDSELQAKADLFRSAQLILLDHELQTSDADQLSLTVTDGAGFVSHLRSWARRKVIQLPPLAILTNKSEAYANETPSVGPATPLGDFQGKEHRIAPKLDVEWLLYKNDTDVKDKISWLAKANADIREVIGTDGASFLDIARALKIPDTAVWKSRALEDLHRSGSPVSGGDGRAAQVLRWLLHIALPYPGLFLSDLQTAWSVGIEVESLDQILRSEGALPTLFRQARYEGPCSLLLGRRWWRAGIDQVNYELETAGRTHGDRRATFANLLRGAEISVREDASSEVVVLDADLKEVGFAKLSEATQIHPPGWPAEAQEPWILRSELENDPVLSAMAEPLVN